MIFTSAAQFIWKNARLLERAIFAHRFYSSSASRIIVILRTYQNEDGGFGHALEPDVRAPDSQPVFAEFALRTLYECNLRDGAIAKGVCAFLSRHADLKQGIAAIFPSSRQYPRAVHWNNPSSEVPSVDRLTGLVGLLSWHGVQHPWLSQAIESCLEHIRTTQFTDAHTIRTSFCLIESLTNKRDVCDLHNKLKEELFQARFFCLTTPVNVYGLTPLHFAPSPDSYCRSLFNDGQIEAHLDDLATRQQADGGWPISWTPPEGAAQSEWRAHMTLNALSVLHAYGKIKPV